MKNPEQVIYWLEKESLMDIVYVHSRSFLGAYETAGKSLEQIESEIYREHIYISKIEFLEMVDVVLDHTKFVPKGIGLELGAGCGALSIEIAKRFSEIEKVYAVEIVPEITEIAMCKLIEVTNASKVVPVLGSFDDIRLSDNQVDWIIEFDSLHHSFDLQRTLAEAARVLKHGGKLIAIDRAHWNTSQKRRKELENVPYSKKFLIDRGWDENKVITRAENGEHEHLLTEYINLLYMAGFTKVEWLNLINPSFQTVKLALISSIPSFLRRHTRYHYVQFWPAWLVVPVILAMKITGVDKIGNFVKLPREKNSNRFQSKTVLVATK
jgi:ubiquinone/menaquinone biosynthesis C-methylase UbiE